MEVERLQQVKGNIDFNERVLNHADLYLTHKDSTYRSVAKITGWSRSTVENDIKIHLKEIDEDLYKLASEKIQMNLAMRYIKGGQNSGKSRRKINE